MWRPCHRRSCEPGWDVCPRAGATAVADLLHQDAVGPVALSPIMHWLRDLGAGVDEFNHSVLLETHEGVRRDRLAEALQHLLDRHDVLRMRVPRLAGGAVWTASIPPPGEVSA